MFRKALVRVAPMAAMLAAVLSMTGCLGKRYAVNAAQLYPKHSIITNQEQPRDVPIPEGFEYLPRDSFAYFGSFRVMELHYIGTPLIERVAEFLEDQMPKHGWTFMRREGIQYLTLLFVNERNEVRYTLHRYGTKTEMQLRITPRDVKPYGL